VSVSQPPKHVESGEVLKILNTWAEGMSLTEGGYPWNCPERRSFQRLRNRYDSLDSAAHLARAAGHLCGVAEGSRAYLIERMHTYYNEFVSTYDERRNYRMRGDMRAL
jgi:hypothetical protein